MGNSSILELFALLTYEFRTPFQIRIVLLRNDAVCNFSDSKGRCRRPQLLSKYQGRGAAGQELGPEDVLVPSLIFPNDFNPNLLESLFGSQDEQE